VTRLQDIFQFPKKMWISFWNIKYLS